MNQVEIREAEESDFPFIYTTWLKGLRFGNDIYALIEYGSYFRNYHKIIEIILHRADTEIRVACLSDDPTTILGYSVSGKEMLHYVHVKKAFRGFGIARKLCEQPFSRVTHVTKMGWNILKDKNPKCIFDPFL